MGRRAASLLAVAVGPLAIAGTRVVQQFSNESDVTMRYINVQFENMPAERQWQNDFGEHYWVAKIANGRVSTLPGKDGETVGTVYDDTRVFDAHGIFGADESFPTSAAAYVDYDSLYTTLQIYGAEFYHFHIETLPKLLVALEIRRAEPDMKILMFSLRNEYQIRTMELLGLDNTTLVFAATNPLRMENYACAQLHQCTDFRAKSLYMPSPSRQFWPGGDVLDAARTLMYSAISQSATPAQTTIVVVSRATTKSRKWANELACIEALRRSFPKEQIEIYPDTGMASDDMVRLFARAKIVLGPHGGGLAGIMFAPPGTTVLEIDMQGNSFCFQQIAEAEQLHYVALKGNYTWHDTELYVNEEALIGKVKDLLDEREAASYGGASASAFGVGGAGNPGGGGDSNGDGSGNPQIKGAAAMRGGVGISGPVTSSLRGVRQGEALQPENDLGASLGALPVPLHKGGRQRHPKQTYSWTDALEPDRMLQPPNARSIVKLTSLRSRQASSSSHSSAASSSSTPLLGA